MTVRLPEELHRALRVASRRMRRTSSDIVRRALQEYLGARAGTQSRPADRVRRLIGSLESRVPDLAERHRAYALEPVYRIEGRRRFRR